MVATEQMYLLFAYGIPLFILYVLLFIAILGGDPAPTSSPSSFYSLLLFIGIMDLITWLISIITYRLVLFMPFYDFFHEFDPNWQTQAIYLITWYACCARDFGSISLMLNRVSSLLFNNKTWRGRTIFLSYFICLLTAGCLNFYNFDTSVQYQRVPMGNSTYIYFMLLDEMEREWLNEPSVILGWSAFSYSARAALLLLLGFQFLCGGLHPEVEKKEYKFTLIAFLLWGADTGFLVNQIMSFLVDRQDMLASLQAVREGAPLIPFVLDFRIFPVPLLMFVLDSACRQKMLGVIGMGGKVESMNGSA